MIFDGFISYSHAADGQLAPALQRGLHRLAKPWHRRRALWIFRDQTGLSVTPALWSSIQQALDGSEWFVLLASPEAARSAWVNREIEHWIATKPAERILPVLTDGTWAWDPRSGDLAADSTAVPHALRGVFAEEPLFLDLRWARDDQHLNLRHARFREAVAQLAAPMHGVSKDELEGEDVRQDRRGRRLRRVAVAAVALLTVVASMAAVLADRNADLATASAAEALRQEQSAVLQQGNAERAAAEAQRQQENAQEQEARARTAADETRRQEERAREQQAAAERAAVEAARQQRNARRQQKLSERAASLARDMEAVAAEQSSLARQSARETARQRAIAEQQQRFAAEAAAEAERQKKLAQYQQRMAEEAAAEAARQEAAARENEKKAQEAAEEAKRQEANAAAQKNVAIGRRLLNQARSRVGTEPATALRLGIAAQRLDPGAETRNELAGIVASTRWLGAASDEVDFAAYGQAGVVAAAYTDGTMALWSMADTAAPVQLSRLDGDGFVSPPVFSPDGRTLVAVESGFQPAIYDVSDPTRPVEVGRMPEVMADTLTFSPDGRTLAVTDFRGSALTLWDVGDRAKPVQLTPQPLPAPTGSITFSHDGRTMVTAGAPAIVWDITDRTRPVEVSTVKGDWNSALFSPTRPVLATNSLDGYITFWLMDDRTKPRVISTKYMSGPAEAFSRNGLSLAARAGDEGWQIWDMTDDTPVHFADVNDGSGSGVSASFSPDGRTLATTGLSGPISLWTVEEHGSPQVAGRAARPYKQGLAASLTPDARRLTTVHADGSVAVWDMTRPGGPAELATARAHTGPVRAAAVSPDGGTVAVVSHTLDGTVQLTDLSDPAKPVTLGALPGAHRSVQLTFSPDGRTLATAVPFGVTLWDLGDRRKPVQQATVESIDPNALAFSPDGDTLAVTDREWIRLYDVTDRAQPIATATLKGHTDRVSALAFTNDGRTLASGGWDNTVALWNVAGETSRRRLAVIRDLPARVWSVAFSPDGRTVAIGDMDNTASLWDVAGLSGPLQMATLKRTDSQSRWLFFHPDDRTLTTSGTDFTRTKVVVWDYSALIALRTDPNRVTCAVTGGGFTPEEWAAYIPDTPYQPTCS